MRGLQSAGVIATLKHFAGYSASRAGRNHGPVSMGRRELLDVILPPFEMAVALAGAGSVMNSYSDVDGVPAGADSWLLTDVLRDEWGFEGTVVSDYWAVPFLASMHRVAADTDAAGRAGADRRHRRRAAGHSRLRHRAWSTGSAAASSPTSSSTAPSGGCSRRRSQLGLLDPDWTPEGSVLDADTRPRLGGQPRHLAREMAERSVVLLDAGTALPLLGDGRPALRRVAVVGPCAADPRTFMGCYAFPNHVLPRYPGVGLGVDVPSGVDALRAELPDVEVVLRARAARCRATTGPASPRRSRPPGTPTCASRSSATSPACSDSAPRARAATPRTSGCPGLQADLIDRAARDRHAGGRRRRLRTPLRARATCTAGPPVWSRPSCRARRAARPSPACCPVASSPAASCRCRSRGHAGGQPSTYLQPALGGAESAGISSLDATPLFPFGYGASYTSFEVDDLRLSDTEVSTDGEFTVTVRVRNTGPRAGDEVVQLYLHDVAGPGGPTGEAADRLRARRSGAG